MRFECQHCGNCCRHNGALRFTKQDWENLQRYLNVSDEELRNKYDVDDVDGKLFFINVKGYCPFLDSNNLCTIQEVKPLFCKLYIPFIDNEDSWIFKNCKGIGLGKEYTKEEVNDISSKLIKELVIVKEDN